MFDKHRVTERRRHEINMEQRESLKRQIDLLQNLIDKHKSVHGNTPRLPEGSSSSKSKTQSTSIINAHSSRALPSHGNWRKKYSLKNKHHVSTLSSSSPQQPPHIQVSSHNAQTGEKSGSSKPYTSVIVPHKKEEQKESVITGIPNFVSERRDSFKKVATVPQSVLLEKRTQHQKHQQRAAETVGVPLTKSSCSSESCSSGKASSSTQYSGNTGQVVPDASSAPRFSPFKIPNQALNDHLQTCQATRRVMLRTKSKFTWVKSQSIEGVEPKPSGSISSFASKVLKVNSTLAAQDGAMTLSSAVIRRTPAKKSRKLSPIITGSRASKYKWVSSSAGLQAKTFRKSSPKSLPNDQRTLEKEDAMKKQKSGSVISPRLKRGFVTSATRSSFSRYRWKAGSPRSSLAGAAVPLHRSTFVWTSEKNNKGAKKGLVCSPLPQSYSSQSPHNSFKLRSRMKIIRKSTNSPNGSGSIKGGLATTVKHSPRGRIHSFNRASMGARKTPTRELVSFGRHKLRRLSPTSSRASPAFSFHRTPALQRICRPQYKMVSHPGFGSSYSPLYHPTLSWRAKKIQSARSFLQSRHRSSLNRYPETTQHWKESGMCWIRGNLYQVSANKLSRTVCHNMSINRTGRGSSFFQVSSVHSATNRPYSPRHFASRAVQRSLAIIRQARQKKQRQYCMYYNRFGKCNRGSSCPYIHDPDKVAVCTRFLRGTCKQPDGACPFSHKVSKEKMPVCSYFLKGICNNSNCPYSHVYVSQKAKVCEDFVKGYCPEGEKCKKKHTLVCPDFSKTGSCPRGTRCKLQHRQRAKRSTSTHVSACSSERPKRARLSVVIPQRTQETPGTPAKSSLELPSFISLSSSPEEVDSPDPLHAKTTAVKERNLQIKPRL
ncbi:zinc finger CCCH domain-containing protein 3 [Corythoichthys intestinalis]|uniref:zinc finger CCCH domain-containing protein 3 n=1 Tax=Corythoichthys intestinalis TaxID=161448 RepID=UPI0025A6011C|nr:zinc finger CCCH domain-containing protein 3 [Corythoichthys intestinalis]